MLFLAYFSFLLSFLSIFLNISHPPGMRGKSISYYEDPSNAILIGLIQLLIGVFLYYYAKKTKKKELEEKISICPKCQDSFEYDRLDEGRCKNCQDEKTIDIKEYYKNN